MKMWGRALTLEPQTGGNFHTFLLSVSEFCVSSVTSCCSPDADRLCASIGLSALSALLLLLSCLLLVCQRCTRRGKQPGESITLLYSLLGNVCSTVGAFLSRQLLIQVLMGAFAAALDAVSFISVLLCWNSKAERRLRMKRGRRRQHLLAVCVLMVVAGGFLRSGVADRPLSGRRLLHAALLQDNTEILGYTLGLLSFVIACTSRFPALCRAYRGQMLTRAFVFSGLLCSLAAALYAAALLLYDTQPGFLSRVAPWLLSAICCVVLDLLILVIHWCKRGTRWQLTSFSPDTESLLGVSGIPAEDNAVMKRKQQVHPSTLTKVKQKMTEMGRYMDVSVQPARKICVEEVEVRPLNGTVRRIRVDSFCCSDSSCGSSLVSSDLEWDFEEANAQWREPTAKQQEGDELPTQEWPKNPEPFNMCMCPMLGLGVPQRTVFGREEGESVSSAK